MQEKNTTTPRVKTGIKGRNETRSALWAGHLEDPIVALDKALKCVGVSVLRLIVGSRLLLNRGCNDLRPCGFMIWSQPFWGKTCLRPFLDAASTQCERLQGQYGLRSGERPREVLLKKIAEGLQGAGSNLGPASQPKK